MATISTIAGSDGISPSRTVINQNFANLNTDKIETSVLDTDTTMSADSDAKIPSQKAVKAYVDAGGNVNASTTARGIVEIATDAEVTAGTPTGGSGATLVVTPASLKTASLPVIQTYLNAVSPATWTKPAGLKYIVVEVQAAGGNGGDASAGGSAGDQGGGGGAGGYGKKIITAASLGATETVTIGAVGANSSFGTHVTAVFGANAINDGRGLGGTCSGGNVNVTGGDGHAVSSGTAREEFGGNGGASFFGGGGAGAPGQSTSAAAGQPGRAYGSGGGGAAADNSTSASGGAGGPAIVIVTEYYV